MIQLTLNPIDGAMSPEKCKNVARNKVQTNSRYKNFTQSMYTAGDIDQFNSSRIRKSLISKNFPIEEMNLNIFSNDKVIPLIWHKYKHLDSRSVSNTFKYIFYKLKKGIFVRIANNELQTFLPFTNAHYKNEFADRLQVLPRFGNVQSFLDYVSKKSGYPKSQDHIPLDEWVANNALVRFEFQRNEGDNNVVTLFNMFKTLCEKRNVPDIEFFVNRRDFPQLKNNDTEPYNHIYDSQHFSLLSHKYDKYAPILSGSTSNNFADIAFPTYEDWARSVNQETGNVFPYSCREYPKIIKSDWKNKIEKAVFRGATTGAGVTARTNQRLKALDLSEKRPDLLDVGITSWNFRPRKYEGEPYLQTIERSQYPKANKLNLQDQSRFKYILNLEGHVAAYRLSYELSTESVILLADSKWKMWYYKFLKPYIHYVPVSEDLHDLVQKIEWCKNNDAECEKIALNAKKFYDTYLGTRGVLDFIQKQLWELSKVTGVYDYLPDLLLWSIEDEKRQLENSIVYNNLQFKFNIPNGSRCIGRLDGTLKVFQSKSIKDLNFKTNLFRNVNGVIRLFETNNFWIVGKQANNDAKILEHTHEAYIGLNSINTLVAKIPNFAYVYGLLKPTPDDKTFWAARGEGTYGPMVFVEYIKGPSMMDWLNSEEYNFRQLIGILIQINLALTVAQNCVGFVHYDLYPWNVVLQKIKVKVTFDYVVDSKTVFTFKTDLIPVIIDYGKSRTVVYEKKYGLIDHGFANLFKSNSIIDTLTFLFGTINVLKKNTPELLKLLEFGQSIQLNNYKDSKHHGKYGSLFNFQNPLNAKPINFINFLIEKYPQYSQNFSYKKTKRGNPINQMMEGNPIFTINQMMEGGNPIFTINQMMLGNDNSALLEVILHIDKSAPPISTDYFFQIVIQNILKRRTAWIESEVMSKGDSFVKQKWNTVKQIFNYQPRTMTSSPLIDYPTPEAIWLDDEITSRYIENTPINPHTEHNWSQIWMLCVDAYLFNIAPRADPSTFGAFIDLDWFLNQNAIASNNTLAKIKKILI